MNTKKIILVFSSILLMYSTYGQVKVDSTEYYIKLNDNYCKKAIEYCIADLQKWNSENYPQGGMVVVRVNTINSSETIYNVSEVFTLSDVYQVAPDAYTFINHTPVLWVQGKSIAGMQSNAFMTFLCVKFNYLLFDDLRYDNIINESNPQNNSCKVYTRYAKEIFFEDIITGGKTISISNELKKKMKSTAVDIPKQIVNFTINYNVRCSAKKVLIDKNEVIYNRNINIIN